MAKRFGSKFSPNATGSAEHPQVAKSLERVRKSREMRRANFLFIIALPFALVAMFSEAGGFAFNLVALGLLLLGAWLTREGLVAEEAYNSRSVARRPALPRKILGGISVGLALFAGGFWDSGPISGLIYGIAGTALHLFSFGLDPLRNKGASAADLHQNDRINRAIDRAESHLAQMMAALEGTGDRALIDRAKDFSQTARRLFETIANDPRDLPGARKFLSVYLEGASGAASKYAGLLEKGPAEEKRSDLMALLEDMNVNFASRTEKALANDQTDLSVEIDVLRERLAREGLASDENKR